MPFGLYEYALPVVLNGSVLCIIYAGNAATDKEKSLGKLSKASRLTGVDSKLLKNALAGAEVLCGPESLENAAGVVKDYITLVLSRKKLSLQSGENWRVHEVREYLLANYTRNITLKQLARLYFANEKYLGRLFRRETGLTVKQFINARRLEKTENELIFTEKAVLDIALDAGFSNVTYFNRLFFQKHAHAARRSSGSLIRANDDFCAPFGPVGKYSGKISKLLGFHHGRNVDPLSVDKRKRAALSIRINIGSFYRDLLFKKFERLYLYRIAGRGEAEEHNGRLFAGKADGLLHRARLSDAFYHDRDAVDPVAFYHLSGVLFYGSITMSAPSSFAFLSFFSSGSIAMIFAAPEIFASCIIIIPIIPQPMTATVSPEVMPQRSIP